jgi:hypothetical protein
MKMKKIIIGCSVLFAAAMVIVGCNKKTNPEPVQDKEFQSSKDAVFANSVAADLEIICSYMGENLLYSAYFFPAPGTAPGSTISIVADTTSSSPKLEVTYTNSVTCRDGKKRNGTITMKYSSIPTTDGAKFYRQPSYNATVTLNNYWVDGWLIDDVTPLLSKTSCLLTLTKVLILSNGRSPAS